VAPEIVAAVRDFGPPLLFLFSVRVLPVAGIHGAEHKVVHAIERGEPLELTAVRRMPRVHPRCGTNLAVGVSLFLTLATLQWTTSETLRALAAAFATLLLWKPLGNVVQFLITTSNPSDKQLSSAIRVGEQLIQRYQRFPHARAGVLRRLALSGLFHVVAGSLLAMGLLQAASLIFGFELPVAV
jgi:uncharacterized protein YqhQ